MTERKLTLRGEFDKALAEHAGRFDVELDESARARLGDYFELLMRWNPRLHLVAPCSPAEFAVRHVLESLLSLRFLRVGARFLDVGSGGGLPAIPCLLARPGLRAVLFESSKKKAVFLREALGAFGLSGSTGVVAERFEKVTPPPADFLTCRAIERFEQQFETMVGWAPERCTLLFFAGPRVLEKIEERGMAHEAVRVPFSEQRYLFAVMPA